MIYCYISSYQFPERQARRDMGCLIVLCLLMLLSGVKVSAEPAEYQAEAYQTSMKIKIDGILDEPDWQKAKPIDQFAQIQPNEGEPITQSTEARILYDNEKIYFGYTCFDSDISKAVINEMRRDADGLKSNDHCFVLLDPYNDRRTAVFFRLTALGGVEDATVSDCGDSRNYSWSAVWECQGQIGEDHWTVEFAIPFSQLRFNKSDVMT